MERIVLGKTGLDICRLGFGGIPIQRVEEVRAVEMVRYAVESGVDFIDTARAYTTSEKRIGMALKQIDRPVTLASKSPERTSDGIRKDIETSLKELQLDYIDLYQCHNPKDEEDYSKIISPGGALEGLLRAREEGMIGHVGVSCHSLGLLERIIHEDLFETVMVCFSLLEYESREKVIPAAMDKNIGVIAMKSFSGGVLENPILALKFVLSQPGVVIIPGVEDKGLFDENLAVFQGERHLSKEETREIERIRQRFDKTFCRRCNYCQPCTEEIPIQIMLGLRYVVKRFGNAALEKEWITNALDKARNCSECGECITRCPYRLPIPDLIREILEWVDGGLT